MEMGREGSRERKREETRRREGLGTVRNRERERERVEPQDSAGQSSKAKRAGTANWLCSPWRGAAQGKGVATRDQSGAEQRSVAQKQNCSQTFSSGGCSIVRIMLQIYEKT